MRDRICLTFALLLTFVPSWALEVFIDAQRFMRGE
jgi:hypothetical protein